MNLHFTGLLELNGSRKDTKTVALKDRSKETLRRAWRQAFRKYIPYYLKEYGFFPLLAGPFFWKVMLGNWLSEVLRDIYCAAMIFPGHSGDAASYPEGTKAKSRGDWYAMQVETTNNYEVNGVVSILCGGLDRQIEHHLFPGVAPKRIRKIVPEVRRICEEHGVEYRTGSWPKMLGRALSRVRELEKTDAKGIGGAVRATLETMA
jgi:linoleoyl-CoA desaturase